MLEKYIKPKRSQKISTINISISSLIHYNSVLHFDIKITYIILFHVNQTTRNNFQNQ